MNDLSHEARSLLAVARQVTVPTERRRQRIKHTVLLRVAAVSAASAGAGVAGAASLATKVVVTALLASVVTGGAYGVWRWHSSGAPSLRPGLPAPIARPQRRPAVAATGAAPQPLAIEAQAPQSPLGLGQPARPEAQLGPRPPSLASTPPRAPRARDAEPPVWRANDGLAAASVPVVAMNDDRPPAAAPTEPVLPAWPLPGPSEARSPRTEPSSGLALAMNPQPAQKAMARPSPAARSLSGPPASGSLVREVALLRRAHEALRDGKPQLALRVLGDYDHEFPHGTLREERAAIAVIAACQAQPGPQSRARAQEFLRKVPGTLLAEGVRAACRPPDRGQP